MPTLDSNRIASYTNKKSLFVFLAALALCIVFSCFVKKAPAVTFIAVPLTVCAAFVADKILIAAGRRVYGENFTRKMLKPVTAVCCVAVLFTAGCLAFGITGYSAAAKKAENGNVVASFETMDEAIAFVQTNTLSDKYDCVTDVVVTGESSFTLGAVFTPKSGESDPNDFTAYKDATLNPDDTVSVTIKGYTVEYNGREYTYYMLNGRCQTDAKIVADAEGVEVVSNLSAFGNAIGAAMGATLAIVVATAAYIIGILLIIIPSEIYFASAIRKMSRSLNATESHEVQI